MNVDFNIKLSTKDAGQTAAQYLRAYFPFLPAEQWQHFLNRNNLRIDSHLAQISTPLQADQTLSFTIENYQEDPVNCEWQLLWQNSELLAVHKPAGLAVSRTTRNIYYNLNSLLQRHNWPEAQVLHRLDKDTAGSIVVAKTALAASRWQPQIQQLIQHKTYHAIVYGRPGWELYSCECLLAKHRESLIRSKMHVCIDSDNSAYIKPKHSHSEFKVLCSNGHYSIIECHLITGRKHQLRAQLAHLGHPIVGDKIYANNGEYYLKRLSDQLTAADNDKLKTDHHLLFAKSIKLHLDEKQSIEINNDHFSQQWQEFTHTHQLLAPVQ